MENQNNYDKVDMLLKSAALPAVVCDVVGQKGVCKTPYI